MSPVVRPVLDHLSYLVIVVIIACGSSLSGYATLPSELEQREHDAYLEGYIQALVNAHYYEFDILVYVEDQDVYLYNLPKNSLLAKSIITFVQDIPEVHSVTPVDAFPKTREEKLRQMEVQPRIRGIWFPQQTMLYPPMLANPLGAFYSAAYHIGDNVVGTKSIAVSLGDNFPIFRWLNLFQGDGDIQIGIQAGAFFVFNMGVDHPHEISELVNTDYLVALPITYAFDRWAFRLRLYHVSGHLGDEFIINHPQVERVNPSMEAIDLFVSCQVNDTFRLYIGPGWILHSDRTFPLEPPLYLEYGGEGRFLAKTSDYHNLHGTCFVATYFRNWQVNHWRFDSTVMAGYEWSKLQGVGRKMRLFVNYHNGYSVGQFFKTSTSYTGFGLSWGF